MSRVKGYGLENYSQGELIADFSRGQMVDGSYSTAGGGQSTLSVSANTARLTWLQLGRYVTAYHTKLGLHAGFIDTPWTATAPVGITVYNAAYAMSLRTPDNPQVLTGTVYSIIEQMIEQVNAQEELYIRLGETEGDDITRTETLDQRTYWEQITALAARARKEILIRPQIVDQQLIIYVDVKDRIGVDTDFLLHDDDTPGGRANIQLIDATVDGKITNRLIGIGSQSAGVARLQTEPQLTQESADIFRMRSGVTQFPNVVDDTTLLRNTQSRVAYTSWPRLIMRINILDVAETFYNVRPGNSFMLHIAKNLYLPGGVASWRGIARLMVNHYDEPSETVGATMEAIYYGNA